MMGLIENKDAVLATVRKQIEVAQLIWARGVQSRLRVLLDLLIIRFYIGPNGLQCGVSQSAARQGWDLLWSLRR